MSPACSLCVLVSDGDESCVLDSAQDLDLQTAVGKSFGLSESLFVCDNENT